MEKISVTINDMVFKDDEIQDCLIGWDDGVMRVLIKTSKPINELTYTSPGPVEEIIQDETEIEKPEIDSSKLPSKEPYPELKPEGEYKLIEENYDRLVALSNLRGKEDKEGKEGEKEIFKINSGEYNINDFDALDSAVDDIVSHETELFERGYFFHKEVKYPFLVFKDDQETFELQEQIVVTSKKEE